MMESTLHRGAPPFRMPIKHPGDPAPSPIRSALLGFLAQVQPGQRYALYPAGRYTQACIEDTPVDCLESDGRRLIGFVDDDPATAMLLDRPIAPLAEVADSWSVDAILLLRDSHDGRLSRRIAVMQGDGRLANVRIVTQPTPTLGAMTAHLGSYQPDCTFSPAFLQVCNAADSVTPSDRPAGSTLLCTMDGEAFVDDRGTDRDAYADVMRAFCGLLSEFGFSASLCVQLHDSPGVFLRTPDAVVETVIDAFGPEAVELHGLDHAMPVEGYAVEWLQRGLSELRTRYGVSSRYWAPPGWTLNWRTLAALSQVPQIQAVRGMASGVNWRWPASPVTFRFPYRVGSVWQIPYAYADWMFMDQRCRPVALGDMVHLHERLARLAAHAPCLMETVVHPYRLVGPDHRHRLSLVRETLAVYASHGVRLAKVKDVGAMCSDGLHDQSRRL